MIAIRGFSLLGGPSIQGSRSHLNSATSLFKASRSASIAGRAEASDSMSTVPPRSSNLEWAATVKLMSALTYSTRACTSDNIERTCIFLWAATMLDPAAGSHRLRHLRGATSWRSDYLAALSMLQMSHRRHVRRMRQSQSLSSYHEARAMALPTDALLSLRNPLWICGCRAVT